MTQILKEPRYKDRAYLNWLREQPCVFTGSEQCEPCHGKPLGKGMKGHDFHAATMDFNLHREQTDQSWDTFLRVNLARYPWLLYRAWECMWLVTFLHKKLDVPSDYELVKKLEEAKWHTLNIE